VSENGDASAPAPVVDRDLHPYSIQAFLNAIHLDDLSASRGLRRPALQRKPARSTGVRIGVRGYGAGGAGRLFPAGLASSVHRAGPRVAAVIAVAESVGYRFTTPLLHWC